MKKAKTDFKEYMDAFEDELQSFLKRVKERAQARIDKAMKEAEEVRLNKPCRNKFLFFLSSIFRELVLCVLLCSLPRHCIFPFRLVLN